MPRRHPKKKNSGPRHANLTREYLHEPAVATLPGAIYKVLVALHAEYHGKNNGALSMTREIASGYGITSVNTLARALSGKRPHGELVARGLVVITEPGSYYPVRIARYALTSKPLDDTEYSQAERLASHAYRKWEPTEEVLDTRTRRRQRSAMAADAKKQKRLSHGGTRPAPMVGPGEPGETVEDAELAPMVGPNNAAPGSHGGTRLRSNHRFTANGGGTS